MILEAIDDEFQGKTHLVCMNMKIYLKEEYVNSVEMNRACRLFLQNMNNLANVFPGSGNQNKAKKKRHRDKKKTLKSSKLSKILAGSRDT